MKKMNPTALFRFGVLGPLVSRDQLSRGERKQIIEELASKTYHIPGTQRVHLSAASISRWYDLWRANSIEGLVPQVREDKGRSQLSDTIQQAILTAKKEKPSRSINGIRCLLEQQGLVGKGELSRSSLYRLLRSHNLGKRTASNAEQIERRRFLAERAGDLWQGDVLHAPTISLNGKRHKLYLVSLIDDASRLITHSEFRFSEAAHDIEAVLKQAILKRGLPRQLLVDNGSAYRTHSLQGICARLKIRLVHSRPYEPAGKGKIEKWHATFRQDFLNEIDWSCVDNINDANQRLWAWLDQIYHQRVHAGLGLDSKLSPIERWRKDLVHVRSLGLYTQQLDALFYHRHKRKVRKDGCVSLNQKLFEVPYEYVGQQVILVFDSEKSEGKWIESESGEKLGDVVALDPIKNNRRTRQRPTKKVSAVSLPNTLSNTVELAYETQKKTLDIESCYVPLYMIDFVSTSFR